MIQQSKYIQAEQARVKRLQKRLIEAEVSQKATVTKKAIDYRRGSYQFTTRRKWQKKYCVN